jgi:AraC-like DNA-binding protein
VSDALALLAARCHEPALRLEDIAAELRLSRCHLSRLISAETGQTYRRHLTELRIRLAITQLDNERLSIKEVAAAVGYSSTASFDHEFRRRCRCSPSEWRRRTCTHLHAASLRPAGGEARVAGMARG